MLEFNINLDLSVYFDDLRKFSSVFVNTSKCKTVGDVERHIKCLFRLEDDICLVHDKFLLPKFEDSQVLRQCGIIQVQICDFFDENNRKKEEICVTNNLALNLIQTEKTVDLSCKPKQRLKSNLNNNYCKASYLLSCDLENGNQSFCTDKYSKNHSKDKIKKKKRRKNVESLIEEYNEDSDSDILDMSVKKVQKTCHDNCFLSVENFDEQELSKSKLKKRKILSDFDGEEVTVSNDVIHSASNEFVSKKKKSKRSSLDNISLIQETSHPQNICCNSEDVLKNNRKRENPLKHQDRNSKTCKTRENNIHFLPENEESQQIQSYCSSNEDSKNYNHAENKCDLEKHLKEKKKLYQNHIDTLLADRPTTLFSSTPDFSVKGGNINSKYTVGIEETKQHNSFFNQVVGQNEEQISQSGEHNAHSNLESSNTKVRRKRVRKHRKNKKYKCLEVVGPILQDLVVQNDEYKLSTPSTNPKHIYFGDKDCNEETVVGTTISSSLETSMQGLFRTNNLNTSQELGSKECPKWQEELLKLASHPKPITFQRCGTFKNNFHETNSKNQDHSDSIASQSLVSKIEKGSYTSPVGSMNNDVKSCNAKDTDNTVENLCTHEAAIPSEKLQDSIKPTSIDLQNVKLSNYPVIDKVVTEDLILFQLLKLNENCEPDVSKVILAKVKSSENFPDKLSLQIVEGSEECELSTRADTNGEEIIVELSWSHLIEPRLFYP